MAQFQHGDVAINYQVSGAGFPLLLIAPGGMNSSIDWWSRAALDPLAVYADDFQLIAMDQRNAGASAGPLDVQDPWGSYIDDQLGLLDHLGVERCHVLGCCIGCSHALGLIQRAPERITSAVLQQPIGIVDDNRELFRNMWTRSTRARSAARSRSWRRTRGRWSRGRTAPSTCGRPSRRSARSCASTRRPPRRPEPGLRRSALPGRVGGVPEVHEQGRRLR